MVDSMMVFCQAAETFLYTYMLVSDFLRAQFHCHLLVGCRRRIETASAWTPSFYALIVPSHLPILTLCLSK